MVRPGAAEFGALLGEHPHTSSTRLKSLIAEAVQPVADLRFELEVMQAPYSAAHASSDYWTYGPDVARLRHDLQGPVA